MNRKASYKDLNKYAATKKKQRDRYYGKFDVYAIKPFTPEQDELILQHSIPDRELSKVIQQSVKRIQTRRCRLKNKRKVELR